MNSLFRQNVIGIIWDFDRTLTPDFMQAPLFAYFGVDEATFWREVRALPEAYRRRGLEHVSEDTMYLNHMLTYAAAGRFPGLDNALLMHLGAGITFYPGMPDCLATCKQTVTVNDACRRYEVTVEHFIVSAGLREMIRGSAIAAHIDGVWACEFIEDPLQPGFEPAEPAETGAGGIAQLGYVIDNTTKTRAIFEINKGANVDPAIGVNDAMAPGNRRIPFEHMIYIADGPSDVPVFSLIRKNGGKTYAVYRDGDQDAFRQARQLLEQHRVDAFGPADYRPDGQTHLWLIDSIRQIAADICARRERAVAEATRKSPGR